jgi:hypothetical protein
MSNRYTKQYGEVEGPYNKDRDKECCLEKAMCLLTDPNLPRCITIKTNILIAAVTGELDIAEIALSLFCWKDPRP